MGSIFMRFLRDQQRLQQFLGGDHNAPFTLRSPCDPPAIPLRSASQSTRSCASLRFGNDFGKMNQCKPCLYVELIRRSLLYLPGVSSAQSVCDLSTSTLFLLVDSLCAVYAERHSGDESNKLLLLHGDRAACAAPARRSRPRRATLE